VDRQSIDVVITRFAVEDLKDINALTLRMEYVVQMELPVLLITDVILLLRHVSLMMLE
jgi:hypothetical protein